MKNPTFRSTPETLNSRQPAWRFFSRKITTLVLLHAIVFQSLIVAVPHVRPLPPAPNRTSPKANQTAESVRTSPEIGVPDSTVTAFNPKRFTRTKGAPNHYVETFTMPAECSGGTYKIVIKNGEQDGSYRISSAEILLNGQTLFVENDFNQNIYQLEKPVTLASQNILEIKLASPPNSYLTIDITGENCGPSDTIAPHLVITSPEDNKATTDPTSVITGTAEDLGSGASGIAQVLLNDATVSYDPVTKIWVANSFPLSIGTNVVTARAVDNAGNESTSQVTIIRDVTAPTISISSPADGAITLDTTATVTGVASDGGTDTSGISRVTVNGTDATLDLVSGNWNLTGVSLAVGTNTVTTTAIDRAGNETTAQITITRVVNHAPTVNAGPDQSIDLPNSAVLNGSGSDDGYPVGSTLSFSWSKVSGDGDVAFSTPNATQTAATFSSSGVYVLRLTASDGLLSTTDDLKVTVRPQNQAPTVFAGNDRTVSLPQAVNLNGLAADDGLPVGNQLTYSWTKVSGSGTVNFTNAASLTTTASFSDPGIYVLRLTASDSLLSASDDLTVTVLPANLPPVVNAGQDQTIYLPNSATLAGNVSDDGLPTGQNVSVRWEKVSAGGTVTFGNATAANTTATFSQSGTYVLRLVATDSNLSASDEVTITVLTANQPPTVHAGANQSVALPSAAILNGQVTDDGSPNNSLTQHWIKVAGAGNVLFANSDALSTTASFNTPGIYILRLIATDGQLTASDDLTIDVTSDSDITPFNYRSFNDSPWASFSGPYFYLEDFEDHALNTPGVRATGGGLVSVLFGPLAHDSVDADDGVLDGSGLAGDNFFNLNGSSGIKFVFDQQVLGHFPTHVAMVYTDGAGQTFFEVFDANGVSLGTKGPFSFPITSHFGEVTNDFFLGAYHREGISGIHIWSTQGGIEVDHLQYGYQSGFVGNTPPTVSAGPAQTISLPTSTVVLQGAVSDDGLPDGSAVQVNWTKVSGGEVVFADPAQVNTTATFSGTGVYVLRLTAADGELSGSSDVTITVDPEPSPTPTPSPTPSPSPVPQNKPPTVDAGTNQTIQLPVSSVNLPGIVSDDGLPNNSLSVAWSKTAGAGNVVFSNPNSAATTATFSSAGSYVLRLTVSDGQFAAWDEVAIVVNPADGDGGQNQPPVVNIGADQTVVLSQSAILEASTISDDGLPVGGTYSSQWSKVSGPGDIAFSNPTDTATFASFSQTGVYVVRLSVSDSELTGSDDLTVTVVDSPPAPIVTITAPDDGASLTQITSITGNVSGGNWKLEYSLADTDDPTKRIWTCFATGSGTASGVLGSLDTTLMLNGLYDIRLTAEDQFGQGSIDLITVSVERNLKIGNFTVSFDDMNIPVAGIPIQVIRTYDSRDTRKGDFGIGWTLGIKNVRVEKNNILGLKWFQTRSDTFIPTYCVEALRPHLVTVTMPDGKVNRFEARLDRQCQQAGPITQAHLIFTPQTGTQGTLSVDGDNTLFVAGSVPGPVDLIAADSSGIFDNTVFKYTSKDGTEFRLAQGSGLQSLKDTNGNTVTVSANGITHSSGKSISFTRDALGRITQITDPDGVSNVYTYDENGDLTAYKDRENNTTTFTYEPTIPHHLRSIVDPLNRTPIRNEYDATGRLLKHIDANGEEIVYTHDLAASAEIVRDRLNNETRYEYDSRGNVLKKRDALGNETTYSYDANDNVLTETNALGKTTTSTYDLFYNRTSVTDPLNHRTEFTYNSQGKVLTVKDARNHVTTNTYDNAGNLLTTKDALGNTTVNTYSAQDGSLLSTKDPLNNLTHFDYFNGFLKKETDALGNETNFSYDANGNRSLQTVQRTNAQGQVETIATSFEYDNLNRLTRTTLADSSFTQTEYNELGQQKASIDQAGNRTEFEYDTLGRLIKTTYADGKFEESTYDVEGRRLTSKDRAGHITAYEYDALGRLKKTTYADGTFTTTNYDAVGQVLNSTDARGNPTAYTYDDAGRRLTVKNALNQITEFTYDASGNQLTLKDALDHTTGYVYDDLNRRTRTNFADSTFTETTFDELGRRITEKEQAGKITQFVYDPLGRLTKVKDALNQETRYEYNEVGQQTKQIDALNRETRYEYDQLGRRTKRILPLGQTETYACGNSGNLDSKTDFNGKTTTFAYDSMRRLLSKTPDASLNQPSVSFTYNDLGQRATMTDASGVTNYVYDVRNRLESKQTPFGTLGYTYDDAGNIQTLRSSNTNGVSVDYSYDQLNRLHTVKDNRLAGSQTTSYAYDAAGNLQSYTYPNQITSSYAYNTVNRLTTMTVANGATNQASYAYTLGAAGNRTQVVEQGGRTVNYVYDDLY